MAWLLEGGDELVTWCQVAAACGRVTHRGHAQARMQGRYGAGPAP